MNDRSRRVVLLIDYDNLQICASRDTPGRDLQLEPVVQLAQRQGTVMVARAYAEWNLSTERMAVYKSGIEPTFAPVLRTESDRSGKSLADTVMVADGMDMLWTLAPDVMVLATSDKDLIPLVRVAQQRGTRVIVVGSDFTAVPLREMADEHYSYRQLITEGGQTGDGRQATPDATRRVSVVRTRESREHREGREHREPRESREHSRESTREQAREARQARAAAAAAAAAAQAPTAPVQAPPPPAPAEEPAPVEAVTPEQPQAVAAEAHDAHEADGQSAARRRRRRGSRRRVERPSLTDLEGIGDGETHEEATPDGVTPATAEAETEPVEASVPAAAEALAEPEAAPALALAAPEVEGETAAAPASNIPEEAPPGDTPAIAAPVVTEMPADPRQAAPQVQPATAAVLNGEEPATAPVAEGVTPAEPEAGQADEAPARRTRRRTTGTTRRTRPTTT